jgi:hypothetical protein
MASHGLSCFSHNILWLLVRPIEYGRYRNWWNGVGLGNSMRSSIWIGIFIGSTIGGMVPGLWGDGMFSYSSVILSGVGAFVGLWAGYKISV